MCFISTLYSYLGKRSNAIHPSRACHNKQINALLGLINQSINQSINQMQYFPDSSTILYLAAILLQLVGGKLAPKLLYIVLKRSS